MKVVRGEIWHSPATKIPSGNALIVKVVPPAAPKFAVVELLNEIVCRADAGESLAVCTVVRTRGSTPQKAGAVLVVLRDGRTLGTIGGGCVEAEVRTQALRLLAEAADVSNPPGGQLLAFRLDGDYGWDDGLVCGGGMEVAVEILTSPDAAAQLRQARDQLAARGSARLVITVADDAGQLTRFERDIEPAPELVIAGAGHVGAALAAVARQMDFHVTVIDDRADMASAERFPGATRIVGPIEAELSRFPVHPHTYIVIVTRGHRHDARALAAIVNSPARYVGLIGSKRKVLSIFEDLKAEGVPRDVLARVHAPIGLDLGAITPGEIAVSIAAELVAVRRGSAERPASPMRLADHHLDRLFL